MNIVVSACLLGENCKYNGGNNRSQAVLDFCEGHRVILVCPECAGGLPIPRVPAERVGAEVIDRDGVNRTQDFIRGTERTLKELEKERIDLAILKSRSPSCGVLKVYDGSFSGKLIEGRGMFAEALSARGVKLLDSGELDEAAPE